MQLLKKRKLRGKEESLQIVIDINTFSFFYFFNFFRFPDDKFVYVQTAIFKHMQLSKKTQIALKRGKSIIFNGYKQKLLIPPISMKFGRNDSFWSK